MPLVKITGLAVPYGVVAIVGKHLTMFRHGAFEQTVSEGGVELWIDHRAASRVARQGNGTLAFENRDDGLYFGASVVGPWGETLCDLSQVGKLNGTSVGLTVTGRGWELSAGPAGDVCVHHEANLREISLCICAKRPAFRETWARAVDPLAA